MMLWTPHKAIFRTQKISHKNGAMEIWAKMGPFWAPGGPEVPVLPSGRNLVCAISGLGPSGLLSWSLLSTPGGFPTTTDSLFATFRVRHSGYSECRILDASNCFSFHCIF